MKLGMLILMSLLMGCLKSETSDFGPKSVSTTAICADENETFGCLPAIAPWTIQMESVDFPAKVSMTIDNLVVLDECSSEKYPGKIKRSGKKTQIHLKSFVTPGNEFLAVEIKDLGATCEFDTIYLSNYNATFDVQMREDKKEIFLDLND